MRAKSDWAESQRVVEAAQAVAAQIDRHMPVAELAQRDVDCICDLRLEGASHLVAADLEPRDWILLAMSMICFRLLQNQTA